MLRERNRCAVRFRWQRWGAPLLKPVQDYVLGEFFGSALGSLPLETHLISKITPTAENGQEHRWRPSSVFHGSLNLNLR
jgi:hypothetical protein